MSNTVPLEILDLGNLMPLAKAKLQSGVYRYLIAQISPVIVLDCWPRERSYVWRVRHGRQKPEKMPNLAPLIENSLQEVYEKRLQNYNKWSGFSLVNQSIADTREKCLRLSRPKRVHFRNETAPLRKQRWPKLTLFLSIMRYTTQKTESVRSAPGLPWEPMVPNSLPEGPISSARRATPRKER
jgi:hypothetical protein